MNLKGFGKPKQPQNSMGALCKTMLASYEEIKHLLSTADDDGKGSRLLAQAVVKWTSGKEEKHIKYGRIFVANAVQNIVKVIDVEYPDYNDYYKLFIALMMIVNLDKEEVFAMYPIT